MTQTLFMAGLDTVTTALAWAWHFLARNPARRAELVDRPELIPGATEELLRLYATVQETRTVVEDTEFAGVQMRAGDRMMVSLSAANRDAGTFTDPTTANFERSPNPQVAFGNGPHRCIGAHLATIQVRVSLEEWHRRIPEYRVPDGFSVTYVGGLNTTMAGLPLILGPAR